MHHFEIAEHRIILYKKKQVAAAVKETSEGGESIWTGLMKKHRVHVYRINKRLFGKKLYWSYSFLTVPA